MKKLKESSAFLKGWMAEWLKASVLKTDDSSKLFVGSNPTLPENLMQTIPGNLIPTLSELGCSF